MKINYKYGLNDSISGDNIAGYAGKIFKKDIFVENGIKYKSLVFHLNAVCIMNIPITIKRNYTDRNFIIEGLKGKTIYGKSETYSNFKKVKISEKHTQWQSTLRGNAYCVINIPIRSNLN